MTNVRIIHDLSDEEVIGKRHSLQFMQRPHLWGSNNIALARRVPATSENPFGTLTGLLVYSEDLQEYCFVSGVNKFLPITEEQRQKKVWGGAGLLDLLDQAGWVVD